jgi:hypothetical protein
MPLRDILMTDEQANRDPLVETRRELHNAYDRIEQLELALRGLLGLAQLLSNNRDIPAEIRELLAINHRVIDAMELLR